MHPDGVAGTWIGVPEVEVAGVEGVKPVDVLGRRDGVRHLRLVHVRRQRELHEDPVDLVVGVQPVDEREDVAPRSCRPGGARRGRRCPPRSPPCASRRCRRVRPGRRRRARSPARRGRARRPRARRPRARVAASSFPSMRTAVIAATLSDAPHRSAGEGPQPSGRDADSRLKTSAPTPVSTESRPPMFSSRSPWSASRSSR